MRPVCKFQFPVIHKVDNQDICTLSIETRMHSSTMRTVRCSGHFGADEGVWTEFLTHACENITFPQLLLRTVINRKRLRVESVSVQIQTCDSALN